MAYAFCLQCERSIRYVVSAHRQPRWLREFAGAVGRGERPVLLCYACWLVPETGDRVEIIHPPCEAVQLRGAEGVVVAVNGEGRTASYLVAGTDVATGESWQHAFWKHQLRAALHGPPETLTLPLGADTVEPTGS